MNGETVDCYNCGNPNPSWAQVCRSCGLPLRPGRTRPEGPIPTDMDSLISIAAALGAILLAIVVGIIVSGLLPQAPVAISETPTPLPTTTPVATPSTGESAAPSAEESAQPTPELIGKVTFGSSYDTETLKIVTVTNRFGPGTTFCHAIRLTKKFRVSTIQEEVLHVEDDGSLTVVQAREDSALPVSPNRRVAAFCSPETTTGLMDGWGTGRFILSVYRVRDAPELIAQGRFRLNR